MPQTLTNPGHLVEALAWPRHAVEEGSGSSYAPTSRTPPVLLNLLSPWQASSSNIVDHPALQTPPSEISSSNLVAHNPASRTPTLQAPSSEPIADNPTFQTLEGGPITVLPVPSELRGQISVSRYIPAFRQMPGGRTWGPYLVGMPLFLQQSYPLSTYLSFSISTKVPTLMCRHRRTLSNSSKPADSNLTTSAFNPSLCCCELFARPSGMRCRAEASPLA